MRINRRISIFLLLPLLLFSPDVTRTNAEFFSFAAGALGLTGLGAFYSGFYRRAICKFFECCDQNWISPNIAQRLQLEVEEKLYGQHIAQSVVIRAVRAHVSKLNPNKALVMSFHGWTGSGKNFLAKMIAKSVFKKEFHSNFVHLFVATLHFPHQEEVSRYKQQIREWILGNLTACERSIFVFDEVDKMPVQLMDAIIPFIDFYDRIDGVDARKSIFLFLSNSGSNAIAQKALEYYRAGRPREEITLKEMEELMQMSAFNEEGGLKTSRVITKHLIDYFVPFLPLERKHVIMCFEEYLRASGRQIPREQIEKLADSLQYFPKSQPVYSVSGCKQIEQKADFLLSDIIRELHLADEL